MVDCKAFSTKHERNFRSIQLERVRDGSLWYAVKLEEHDRFLNDVISEIEKVQGILDKRGQTATTNNRVKDH